MDSIHYIKSDEYKKLYDKVFKVMLSCRTIEQWESCDKYNKLAVDYALNKAYTTYDKIMISSMGSFRHGFISGMIQSLNEELREKRVEDYLSLGC